jgi:hypothetical protein
MSNYNCLYNGIWVFPFPFLCLSFQVPVTQTHFIANLSSHLPLQNPPDNSSYHSLKMKQRLVVEAIYVVPQFLTPSAVVIDMTQ